MSVTPIVGRLVCGLLLDFLYERISQVESLLQVGVKVLVVLLTFLKSLTQKLHGVEMWSFWVLR